MRILLIHQYFLEKGEGGGSRFNEMTKTWSEQGHKITVLAGMVHYNTGKRINNGFLRLGHNVLAVSDRDMIHDNKGIKDFSGIKSLQNNIIEN